MIVSNPVDILTYTFCKCSDLPEERIIGSGTILDTARLRSRLGECYEINQQNVHAYVLGEHGDSSFIPWSNANISNVPAEEYRNSILHHNGLDYPEINRAEILEYVQKSGGQVIQRKGATFYAVAVSVCHLCKCLLLHDYVRCRNLQALDVVRLMNSRALLAPPSLLFHIKKLSLLQ